MRTGKDGFSRLTRWGRSSVSFLTSRRRNSHRRETCRDIGFTKLKGEYRGFYSVTFAGHDSMIVRFVDGNAVDVDYLDDH